MLQGQVPISPTNSSCSWQTIPHIFAVSAVPGEVSDLGISRFHFQDWWPWLDQLDFYSDNDRVSNTGIITKTGSVTPELPRKMVPFPLTLALILSPEAQPWVLWSVNSLHTQWVFYNSFMCCHTQQLSYPCFKILHSAGMLALSSGNYWVCQKRGFVFPSHLKTENFWDLILQESSKFLTTGSSPVRGLLELLGFVFNEGQMGALKTKFIHPPTSNSSRSWRSKVKRDKNLQHKSLEVSKLQWGAEHLPGFAVWKSLWSDSLSMELIGAFSSLHRTHWKFLGCHSLITNLLRRKTF